MRIDTTAFQNNDFIPAKYTCDGENVSPPLIFEDVPSEAGSFAVLVEDPDAPSGIFTHWIIYDIPTILEGLPEDVPPAPSLEYGIKQGINSFGSIGYKGPCPPMGPPHRYIFTLFALSVKELGIGSEAPKPEFIRAIENQVIDQAEIIGLYSR